MEVTPKQLEDILQCLVRCDHLSASAGGLKERKKHRDQAKSLILNILQVPVFDREDFEDKLYCREVGYNG